MTLTLTVPFDRTESVTSLASRLAARNRFPTVRGFAFAFGLDFQGLVDGSPEALARLADLSGTNPSVLARNAFVRTENRDFCFKGERVIAGMLQRQALTICPRCVLEEMSQGSLYDAFAPTAVELSSIRTCERHSVPHVQLVPRPAPVLTHDFIALLRENLGELPRLADEAQVRAASGLEQYLRSRLEGRPTGANWADTLGFSAVAKASEIFGAVIAFGRKVRLKVLTADNWALAGGVGFDLFRGGRDALVGWVNQMTSSPDLSGLARAQDILGPALNAWLIKCPDPDVAPIREVVREALLDRLPLDEGALLLGRPIEQRRTHSIFTASRSSGVHVLTVRKILSISGHISQESHSLPDNRVIVAPGSIDILERYAEGISLRGIKEHLNMTRPQVELFAPRYLKPVIEAEGVAPVFHPSDLGDFLKRLCANAHAVPAAAAGKYSIVEASRRANRSLLDVVDRLYHGAFEWVGQLDGVRGFQGLLLDLDEVKEVTKLTPLPGRTMKEFSDWFGIRVAASSALVKAQVVGSQTVVHPVNRCPVVVVPFEECDRLKREFASMRDIARERGVWSRHVEAQLASEGVEPDRTWAASGAVVYRRADLKS